jgi:hypothetical protein
MNATRLLQEPEPGIARLAPTGYVGDCVDGGAWSESWTHRRGITHADIARSAALIRNEGKT